MSTAEDRFDPREATVADVHAAMAAGDCTAAGLVATYRARIDAHDDALNAVVTLNDDAPERAAALDEAYAESGLTGPLHGIPVLLKDNQDTADMPTTAGSVALADSVPETDAFVVEQLRDAGAVILGKTNLQEFAFGVDTVSSLGGATRNPYDLDRRPSGSSGGSAVAVAANLATLATGSDTCSSVRSPPAFTDCVGVRPTRGLVSGDGVVPLSSTQDTVGPIARTVEDAARLLDVLAGYDPADPQTALGADEVPQEGYAAQVDPDGLDGARVGVVREYFGLDDTENAPPERVAAAAEVTEVVESAVAEMAAAGAEVVDPVTVVDGDRLESARLVTMEFARDLDAYLDELEDPAYDSLAAIVEAGVVEDSVEQRIREGGVLDVDADGLEDDPEYLARLARRRELRVDTEARLVEHDLDALVYPPSTIPPVEIPAHQPFGEMRCALAAHTGLPAVTVPAGFTDDGLPVGVELLGRSFAEPKLFELAGGFEATTDHRRAPGGFGSLA